MVSVQESSVAFVKGFAERYSTAEPRDFYDAFLNCRQIRLSLSNRTPSSEPEMKFVIVIVQCAECCERLEGKVNRFRVIEPNDGIALLRASSFNTAASDFASATRIACHPNTFPPT